MRRATVLHHQDGPGRPRISVHVDTTDPMIRLLAEALGAWPTADRPAHV